MLEGIAVVKLIYGVLGTYACYQAHKLWTVAYHLRVTKGAPEDHEDYLAVKRHFKCWTVPAVVAFILIYFFT